MKIKLYTSVLACLFSFSVSAQQISLDPVHTINIYEDLDLSDNGLDLEHKVPVTNLTNESIDLLWRRIVPENCPADWQTQICDNETCYLFFVSTNGEGGPNKPYTLSPNEVSDDFALHVWPRQEPGCCRIKVEFSTFDDPDVVIETAIFDTSINTENCDFTVSTNEISEIEMISVFPNPTQDEFTLSDNDLVKKIEIYNLLGQKLKTVDFYEGEFISIDDLNAGVYTLALKNSDGEILKNVLLEKI